MLHGEYKEAGQKLVVVDCSVVDDLLADVSLSGDFFLEPDEALFQINESLVGMPARSSIADLTSAVSSAVNEDAVLMGLTPLGVAVATHRALNDSGRWRGLDWQVVETPPVSPALNVSLDEVLTRAVASGERGPTLRIWNWDSDAITIGSFQSVLNEVDTVEAEAAGAQVLRRISGGGAMYMQSAASISYSLYLPTDFVADLSFEDSYFFLDAWAVEALNTLGVTAAYEPLNDITGPSGKIGGAAQKRFAAGAVLHHATLAYDMDGDLMQRVLRVGQEKIVDKGIRSAAKRVDPLKTQTGLPREAIIQHLIETFKKRHGGHSSDLLETELEEARALASEKFLTPEWTNRVP